MSHRGARWGADSAVGPERWHLGDRTRLTLPYLFGRRPFG
jgi:hypothetical protein